MSSTPQHDADPALAYPEPPAHPLWHRRSPKPQPLTPAQQQHNTEQLRQALRTPPPPHPSPHRHHGGGQLMNPQNHLAADSYGAALATACHARDKDDLTAARRGQDANHTTATWSVRPIVALHQQVQTLDLPQEGASGEGGEEATFQAVLTANAVLIDAFPAPTSL